MSSPAQRVSRIANQTYQRASKIISHQPWWLGLPEDFAQWPDRFDLDTVPQLMVRSTAAVDTVLRSEVHLAVDVRLDISRRDARCDEALGLNLLLDGHYLNPIMRHAA